MCFLSKKKSIINLKYDEQHFLKIIEIMGY
jgi:hypothetical protein